MRLLTLLLAALSICLYSAAASAEAIHACVKPNGEMRIVAATTECRGDETLLSWNVQGPPGPSVVHKDQQGRVVALASPRGAIVPLPEGLFQLDYTDDGFRQSANVSNAFRDFTYLTPNCSGDAYLRLNPAIGILNFGVYSQPLRVVGDTLFFPLNSADIVVPNSDLISAVGRFDSGISLRKREEICIQRGGEFTPPNDCCFGGPLLNAGVGDPITLRPSATSDLSVFVPPFEAEVVGID